MKLQYLQFPPVCISFRVSYDGFSVFGCVCDPDIELTLSVDPRMFVYEWVWTEFNNFF